MPLPWKKTRSGRISRLVADLQQSPKHGGSLVVETGFPTSLIDLFVKNRDRLKKPSSRRRQSSAAAGVDHPPSPPLDSSPSPPLTRRSSFPPPLPVPMSPPREDPAEREAAVASSQIEARVSGESASLGYGARVLVVMVKVFVVAVLAMSTKKLTMGITLSAFALLFLEFAAARVFTCFKLCPDARSRLDSLVLKILGRKKKQGKEKAVAIGDENEGSCEITETLEDSRDCTDGNRAPASNANTVSWSEPESVVIPDKNPGVLCVESSDESKREVQTIRDLVLKSERSKSSKLKSKIVRKIVPKKLRSSMKKKKSMKIKEKEEEELEEEDQGGGGILTEVSSLVLDDKSDRTGSEISERDDDDYSNPPLLVNCTEVGESQGGSANGKNKKNANAIVLFVIVLVGLLGGKVLAIGLFLLWCLILRFAAAAAAAGKSQPVCV